MRPNKSATHVLPQQAAKEIESCLRCIYDARLTTTSGGNVSVVDSEGTLWMTPSGTDKGDLHASEVLSLRAPWPTSPSPEDWYYPHDPLTGEKKKGLRPSIEYHMHKHIYCARPDLRAVVHAHPPFLVSFAITGTAPDAAALVSSALACGSRVAFAPYGLPGSEALGASIGAAFATREGSDDDVSCVMMGSHGVVVASPISLEDAVYKLETLEVCAGTLLCARSLCASPPKLLMADDISFVRNFVREHSLTPLLEDGEFFNSDEIHKGKELLAKFSERSHNQLLFKATRPGVISMRCGDCIIISSAKGDSFVAVGLDGRVYGTQQPSWRVAQHIAVYKKHSWANAIATSDCAIHTLGFGVAGVSEEFSACAIPEGFISVRDLARVRFEDFRACPVEAVANSVTEATPVVHVEHDAVHAVGTSILQAFDRLEVTESLAKAQVYAHMMGLPVLKISGKDIDDLERCFGHKKSK